KRSGSDEMTCKKTSIFLPAIGHFIAALNHNFIHALFRFAQFYNQRTAIIPLHAQRCADVSGKRKNQLISSSVEGECEFTVSVSGSSFGSVLCKDRCRCQWFFGFCVNNFSFNGKLTKCREGHACEDK